MSIIPQRRSRPQEYDLEEEDSYYTQRQPTSAVRYTQPRQQVVQRGNKRIVIHHNEPPPGRKLHWSFILGVGMILMLALWAGGSLLLNWWQNHQLDSTYGMPRTYQTDQVVRHGDSAQHPTHFIAVNLSSHITVIEIPGGNNQHARIYPGPSLYSDNGDQTPVTLEFYDVNGDGKVDMIVHVGDQKFVYLNDGTQFKPQQVGVVMQTVDEKPETIHLYVVRETEPHPSFVPIILSVLALVILVVFCALTPYQQPVTRLSLRVPAALLPLKTFTATIAVIPTGVKVYPATTAHGVLTITNGSVIAQTIPQGFMLGNVITDSSVFVPAGSANGYGYAVVPAHALTSGKVGNIASYAVNQVEGSSVYIRNLSAFSGGWDSYSVKVVIPQDRQTSIDKARSIVGAHIHGLYYPCREFYVSGQKQIFATWRCQFVTYYLPPNMHATGVTILGKNLLVHIWFIARPLRTQGK